MAENNESPTEETVRAQGGAVTSPRRWLAVAGFVVAGLVVAAAGVAVAADSGPGTPASASATSDDDGQRPDKAKRGQHAGQKGHGRGNGRGAGKHLMRGGLLGRALHGEVVVAAGNGSFQTMVFQRGEVTAVSARSITLKSADGFTETYPVSAETRVKARSGGITSAARGSNATVIAVKTGGSLTTELVDNHGRGQGLGLSKPKPSAASSSSST